MLNFQVFKYNYSVGMPICTSLVIDKGSQQPVLVIKLLFQFVWEPDCVHVTLKIYRRKLLMLEDTADFVTFLCDLIRIRFLFQLILESFIYLSFWLCFGMRLTFKTELFVENCYFKSSISWIIVVESVN